MRFIERMYVKTFAKPSMQNINNIVLKFALRSRGYNNFADIRETGERKFFSVLSKFNPGLCIDIGANKGICSRALLEIPGTKVIAFEPLPKAFKSLEDIQKKHPDRFECFNLGIADRDTFLTLHFGEEDSEFASFSSEVNCIGYVGKSNVNTMDVKVKTLDGFLEERKSEVIDLLKIDTEGFEYEVLVGAAKTIRNTPPKFVQLEFNYHQLFRNQSFLSLSKLLPGYKSYQLLPFDYGMELRDPASPESNVYNFSNFIFVREDIVAKL